MNNNDVFVGLWLQGGLGNQMFQYAAGYALARRISANLFLDLSGFDVNDTRSYALDIFNIDKNLWPFHSPVATTKLSLSHVKYSLAKLGLTAAFGYRLVHERNFAFDSSVLSLQESCYLRGYWQAPSYFSDSSGAIKNVFDLSCVQSSRTLFLAQELADGPSVSIHVRRGDYNNSQNLQVHGLCGVDYYNRAAALIRRVEPGCRFYIFSDDTLAAGDIFATWPDAEIMPQGTQEEDMFLMSSCRHHIIANSSFSWWAAWLGEKEETITVAPCRWFARPRLLHTNVLDLFPQGWVLM